eukprot:TRINITY_DN28655_c0_g1_i1.p1 TRINITY_DN28655_c0_g1~~TRINITY_DN28655_c0_g1_i1.p1  ORF type:complete len:189 (+),score=39.60 TRINITY_DN28655_c0_g1_i1:67-567(+)
MVQQLWQVRKTKSRNIVQVIGGMSSWIAAGAFAYFYIKWHRGETRVVNRKTIADEDAAEFEMFQARANTLVKAKDRASASSSEINTTLLEQSVRNQADERNPSYDYMSDMKNVINESGVLTTALHDEALARTAYEDVHGKADFAEERRRLHDRVKERVHGAENGKQ